MDTKFLLLLAVSLCSGGLFAVGSGLLWTWYRAKSSAERLDKLEGRVDDEMRDTREQQAAQLERIGNQQATQLERLAESQAEQLRQMHSIYISRLEDLMGKQDRMDNQLGETREEVATYRSITEQHMTTIADLRSDIRDNTAAVHQVLGSIQPPGREA